MTERPVESVLIEIPKGSRNKYEYDKEKKVIKYDRMLFSSMVYPSDYGFFPDTLALDGDPLDAMVLTWEPTFPGCIIEVHLVALFDMEDDKGKDQKIQSCGQTRNKGNSLRLFHNYLLLLRISFIDRLNTHILCRFIAF